MTTSEDPRNELGLGAQLKGRVTEAHIVLDNLLGPEIDRLGLTIGESDVLTVLPNRLTQEYYGIGLKLGSPLREDVNQALLERTDSEWWAEQRYQYLGHLH